MDRGKVAVREPTRHNGATPVREGSEQKRVLAAIPQIAIYLMVTRSLIRLSHSR